MEPKDILAISGKPGLYKVLNTTHRAIVVEPLGEGKRTAVPASARVSSFEDISIFTYEADLPLAEGAPLRHADYDRSRDALRRLATERGYLDARFTRRELVIDLEAYVAEARLTLDSGRRYHFGPVQFEQDVLDEDLLRRFLPFAPGEPYLAGKLLELQTGLAGSNFFGEVRVVPGTAGRSS